MNSRSIATYAVIGFGCIVVITVVGFGLGSVMQLEEGDHGDPMGPSGMGRFVVLMCAITSGVTVTVALSLIAYETQIITKKLRRRKRRSRSAGDDDDGVDETF